jgi:hypothetical protein
LCLRVNLRHRLKMMMKKNHEQMSKTPGPFWVIDDKGGENMSIESLLTSSVCQNPVEPVSRSRWHRFQCVSASVSLLSGKLGGTKFPEPVAPVLAIVCNRFL